MIQPVPSKGPHPFSKGAVPSLSHPGININTINITTPMLIFNNLIIIVPTRGIILHAMLLAILIYFMYFRDILLKKVKVHTNYDGNPDRVPIRSDEFAFLVRILLHLSSMIDRRWRPKVETWYKMRPGFVYAVFRQVRLLLFGP